MENRKKLVLCILERDGKYLLPLKERKLGAGRRNGLGGGVEVYDASLEDAARREVREEAGVEITKMTRVGQLVISMPNETVEMSVFHATEFSGEPSEQPEQGMKDFQWFDKNALPYELMWPNDVVWYPYFVEGKRFSGGITLGEAGEVLRHDVHEHTDEFKVR